MIKSLLIKAGMLAAAAGCALWIGWPADELPIIDASADAPTGVPVTPSSVPPVPSGSPPEPLVPAAPKVSPSIQAIKSDAVRKVDLNRATVEELQTLPGIGGVLAHRMVERRTIHGLYQTVDDLRNVKGIGGRRLEKLRPFIVAGAPTDKTRKTRQPATTPANDAKRE